MNAWWEWLVLGLALSAILAVVVVGVVLPGRMRPSPSEPPHELAPAPPGYVNAELTDRSLPLVCATCYASVVQRVADEHRAWHEGQEAAWVARRATPDPGLTNNTWRDYLSEPAPIPVADLHTLTGDIAAEDDAS